MVIQKVLWKLITNIVVVSLSGGDSTGELLEEKDNKYWNTLGERNLLNKDLLFYVFHNVEKTTTATQNFSSKKVRYLGL